MLCSVLFCNFSYFPFGFEGWIWVLIASVPDLSILFAFKLDTDQEVLNKRPQCIEEINNGDLLR